MDGRARAAREEGIAIIGCSGFLVDATKTFCTSGPSLKSWQQNHSPLVDAKPVKWERSFAVPESGPFSEWRVFPARAANVVTASHRCRLYFQVNSAKEGAPFPTEASISLARACGYT